jgi:hypothetical protein
LATGRPSISGTVSDCHNLTVNIFLVWNAHHMTVKWPNMPNQPVSRRKLLTTLWRVLGQSWVYFSKRSFRRKEKWRFYMDNKTRWFLTLFMGDFHMLWDATTNTAVNVKKPQTSEVIGFSRGWNQQIMMLENGRFYHSMYLGIL